MTASAAQPAFGIDIGGTGIKGAPVDLASGTLTAERVRIKTPQPATPDAVGKVVAEVVQSFGWTGPVGAAFPAVIKNGVAQTAANVDPSWIGADANEVLTKAVGAPVSVINDADAAGVAEMGFGAGKGHSGCVIMLTFGTGIGTALFVDGRLLPNTELGHLKMHGHDAEKHASELAREREGLSYKEWAKRLDDYLGRLENLLWPDLFIVGGGASAMSDKFLPHLSIRTPIVPAALLNKAGILGAALAASQ
jgi:polyphosphate glucokinase